MLKNLALATLAVFLPIKAVLITVFVLILFDMVSGMVAAYKKGEKITSKGIGRTVLKLLIYETCIVCGFLAEKYLIGDAIPVVKLIAGIVGVTEMVSILENANSISGNTMFAQLIGLLQSKSSKNIDTPPDSK